MFCANGLSNHTNHGHEGDEVQLIDFVDACDMGSKSVIENFELFCFYSYKEKGAMSFSVKNIIEMYDEAGLPAPELSSLRKETKACRSFRPHGIEGTLKFAKDPLRALEKKYGHMWSGAAVNVPSVAPVKGGLWLKNFAKACDIGSRTDIENFELLCYYLEKENRDDSFTIRGMLDVFEDAGLARPDRSALEKEVKKHASFRLKSFDGSVAFTPEGYRALDNRYGHLWTVPQEPVAAPVNSEVIDEAKFCGKRDGFDKLIIQINSSYRNGSFDACAAVMKRLLEASLIFAFQSNGKEKDIRDNGGTYVSFDDLVRKTNSEGSFGLSGSMLSDAAKIGDYSGQGPMYTLGANDINSVRVAYRNVLETLFSAFK
ncbi:MAG: hypothetical protein LBE48_02540 [Methanomassiliicoccaceae archaeon]|jgi:hypothetical protein|nr:hypothetical protein [Methanomassiliicoccaceae archaeon]